MRYTRKESNLIFKATVSQWHFSVSVSVTFLNEVKWWPSVKKAIWSWSHCVCWHEFHKSWKEVKCPHADAEDDLAYQWFAPSSTRTLEKMSSVGNEKNGPAGRVWCRYAQPSTSTIIRRCVIAACWSNNSCCSTCQNHWITLRPLLFGCPN